MRSTDSSKHFAAIHADYTFFEEHANEAEQDLNNYQILLRSWVKTGKLTRYLDFGCGDGRFSTRFLFRAAFPPDSLTISLVEPDEAYLRQTQRLTQASTTTPVSAWPSLPVSTICIPEG